MNQKINEKKAEIFDILVQMENLKLQVSKLDQQKTNLLQELSSLIEKSRTETKTEEKN